MCFGNNLFNSPEYDLRYFQTVIPAELEVIIPGEVTSMEKVQIKTEQNGFGKIFTDKRFIWVSLIVVILLLGFVTFRMMKDIK